MGPISGVAVRLGSLKLDSSWPEKLLHFTQLIERATEFLSDSREASHSDYLANQSNQSLPLSRRGLQTAYSRLSRLPSAVLERTAWVSQAPGSNSTLDFRLICWNLTELASDMARTFNGRERR